VPPRFKEPRRLGKKPIQKDSKPPRGDVSILFPASHSAGNASGSISLGGVAKLRNAKARYPRCELYEIKIYLLVYR
jgi:hypothetical protein